MLQLIPNNVNFLNTSIQNTTEKTTWVVPQSRKVFFICNFEHAYDYQETLYKEAW